MNTLLTIMAIGMGIAVVMLVSQAVHKGEFGNMAYQWAVLTVAALVVSAFTALVYEVAKFFGVLREVGWFH
ncbi:MAG TPA: hypothetical protein GX716_00630 [Firmicutes bacterium]|nr:hypothetical protein [Candidatus Fermentithermobacillaceae bacterium]